MELIAESCLSDVRPGNGPAAHRDSRDPGPVGVDAGRRFVSCGSTAARSPTRSCGDIGSGVQVRSRARVRQLRPVSSIDVFLNGRARTRRAVRRFVRRLHRAALRRDAAGAGHGPGPRVVAGAGLGAERTAAARTWRGHWCQLPAFVATAPMRLWPEIRAAYDTWARAAGVLGASMPRGCIAAPMIPSLMAARVTLQQAIDFAPDCARVKRADARRHRRRRLDQVVPAGGHAAVSGAHSGRAVRSRWRGPGHIGMLTQPTRFADVVTGFLGAIPTELTHAHHH